MFSTEVSVLCKTNSRSSTPRAEWWSMAQSVVELWERGREGLSMAAIVNRCRPLLIPHFDFVGAQKKCALAQTPSLRAQRSNPGATRAVQAAPGLLRRRYGAPCNDGVTVIVNPCRPLLNPPFAARRAGPTRAGPGKSLLIARGQT